jgi:DNA-directed RNA polymerase sigma subunit (sigma70/sigma32)
MRKCATDCFLNTIACANTECRLYLDYEEDQNCTLIAVEKHGSMTLDEIAKRQGVSLVRIKQIVDATLFKLKKTFQKENTN